MAQAHRGFRFPPGRTGPAAPLQAQVATGAMGGRVTDRASELPLLGALVSIADRPSTLSDRDGPQVLVRAVAGAHTVNVSAFRLCEPLSWADGVLSVASSGFLANPNLKRKPGY